MQTLVQRRGLLYKHKFGKIVVARAIAYSKLICQSITDPKFYKYE
jgi:hypothetical protein